MRIIMIVALLLSHQHLTSATQGAFTGQQIFERNCAPCHGTDGTKGRWGAKDLQQSRLTDRELVAVISNGRRIMPAWGEKLNDKEIRLVVDYIKTLRK